MKKVYTICLMLILVGMLMHENLNAQGSEWVNQVLTVNSGRYETTPPFIDYVTVQSYNPASQQVIVLGTIYTQSAQDVVIKGKYAYVAAQDSIVMYDIDNYMRVAAVADSGLNRLYVYNNRLIVTKKSPIKRFFVEVLDAANLSLINRVQNISGDCAGVTSDGNLVYVAVIGGILANEGKLAIINTTNWTLNQEIGFGVDAIGIWDLFNYGGNIYSVNRTPPGVTDMGSITVFNLGNYSFVNKNLGLKVGDGYGILDNLLYLNIQNGVGSFDIINQEIQDTVIIPDPGFISHIYITSGKVDYINNRLYTSVGNKVSWGVGVVSTNAGDSITSYPTGISADAVAVDYRAPVGIQTRESDDFSIYPNPTSDFLIIESIDHNPIQEIFISDLTGKIVYQNQTNTVSRVQLTCKDLPKGFYFLTIKTGQGIFNSKFIKE